MILAVGANVYPAEVEAALDAHPRVRSSAAIGLPDEDLGQRIHAIVDLEGDVMPSCRCTFPSGSPAISCRGASSEPPSRSATMPARSGATPSATRGSAACSDRPRSGLSRSVMTGQLSGLPRGAGGNASG